MEAQWASRDRRLERLVTKQPPYSILVRGIEEDILPAFEVLWLGHADLQPARGRTALRPLAHERCLVPASAARPSASFDMTSAANQRNLDIVDVEVVALGSVIATP